MITAEQIRGARAMLRWDQSELAKAASVSVETVKRLERLSGPLGSTRSDTLHALQQAIEAAGVEFTNGGQPGVRLKPVQRGGMAAEDLNASNDE